VGESEVFQIRIHGRGGQGVVTAAEILSVAAFIEGKHSQAIPSFGSERMGAPVVAYVRIDDAPIELTEPVTTPNAVVIQDPTLLHVVEVFAGLEPKGYVLINTARPLETLHIDEAIGRLPEHHVATVAATELALQHLGRPTPNTVLLGALTGLSGVLRLQSVVDAIKQRFSGELAERNAAAAIAAREACIA
jgi:pyruvate ferredoxin oxidoreductase gamma subunit